MEVPHGAHYQSRALPALPPATALMLAYPVLRAVQAQPYYELTVPDSDEEYEPASADASGMTGVERDTASGQAGPTLSTASDAGTAKHAKQGQEEVEQQAVAQQDGQPAAAAAAQGEQQAAVAAGGAAAGGRTDDAAIAGLTASAADVAGSDATAAQETSNKSEETAVPEAGAEGLSLPPLRAGGAAVRSGKDATEHSSPRKRSRRRPGGMGDAIVEPTADIAVEVAAL